MPFTPQQLFFHVSKNTLLLWKNSYFFILIYERFFCAFFQFGRNGKNKSPQKRVLWKNPGRPFLKRLGAFSSFAYAAPQKYGKQDKGVLLTPLALCSVSIADRPSAPAGRHLTRSLIYIHSGPLLRRFAPCPPGPDDLPESGRYTEIKYRHCFPLPIGASDPPGQ